MTSQSTDVACGTCGHVGPPTDFYGASTECRTCKRTRSQHNRLIAARKIALAERLVDALVELARQGQHLGVVVQGEAERLANQGWHLEAGTAPKTRLQRVPEASTEPREVQP